MRLKERIFAAYNKWNRQIEEKPHDTLRERRQQHPAIAIVTIQAERLNKNIGVNLTPEQEKNFWRAIFRELQNTPVVEDSHSYHSLCELFDRQYELGVDLPKSTPDKPLGQVFIELFEEALGSELSFEAGIKALKEKIENKEAEKAEEKVLWDELCETLGLPRPIEYASADPEKDFWDEICEGLGIGRSIDREKAANRYLFLAMLFDPKFDLNESFWEHLSQSEETPEVKVLIEKKKAAVKKRDDSWNKLCKSLATTEATDPSFKDYHPGQDPNMRGLFDPSSRLSQDTWERNKESFIGLFKLLFTAPPNSIRVPLFEFQVPASVLISKAGLIEAVINEVGRNSHYIGECKHYGSLIEKMYKHCEIPHLSNLVAILRGDSPEKTELQATLKASQQPADLALYALSLILSNELRTKTFNLTANINIPSFLKKLTHSLANYPQDKSHITFPDLMDEFHKAPPGNLYRNLLQSNTGHGLKFVLDNLSKICEKPAFLMHYTCRLTLLYTLCNLDSPNFMAFTISRNGTPQGMEFNTPEELLKNIARHCELYPDPGKRRFNQEYKGPITPEELNAFKLTGADFNPTASSGSRATSVSARLLNPPPPYEPTASDPPPPYSTLPFAQDAAPPRGVIPSAPPPDPLP